jgi:hypothetical protein
MRRISETALLSHFLKRDEIAPLHSITWSARDLVGKSADLALCCQKRWIVEPTFAWISRNQPVTNSNEM